MQIPGHVPRDSGSVRGIGLSHRLVPCPHPTAPTPVVLGLVEKHNRAEETEAEQWAGCRGGGRCAVNHRSSVGADPLGPPCLKVQVSPQPFPFHFSPGLLSPPHILHT